MIDRLAHGGMLIAAAALCACGPDRAKDAGAAADSASGPPPPNPAVSAALGGDSAAVAPADSFDSARWALRADGIGPVRVGMTVAEADRAVGGLDRTAGLEPCDYVRPKKGPGRLSFMVEDGRIARVDVGDSAAIMTSAGVRPGESEARVREAYPGVRVQPHKYDARGHYMVLVPGAPSDTLHRIVFETDGTKVTRMRGGVYPAVEYVEGCS